ncbi:MAG: aldehyde dehydrogenase family protein [Bacteroidetes bacterium]|nr:aldehyde dehydrogenase family protein [Bacteroidota bacterium]
MDIYPVYIGGEFRKTGDVLRITNPFNHEVIAETYRAGPGELEMAIMKAQSVQVTLRDMASYEKYVILMRIADEISARRQWFIQLLSSESAKPLKYATSEIERAVQCFRIAAEESKRMPMEYISLDWTSDGAGKEGLVRHFPVGLVAGIAPFNFPLNLAVHKIAPAIAAGCPVILKPSSLTPLSTLELARIIDNTDLPKGAVSVLPMDRTTGNLLVTDSRFSLLSFTGSPEAGWPMKQQAGKKKVILELGGNAGVVVTKSCDMETTVKKCVTGGFAYSGQVCIHAQRIFIEQGIFDYFIRTFTDAVKNLRYGDPFDPQTDISVMINEQHARRVEEWVSEAVTAGAKVLIGGNRNGNYYQPTLITQTNPAMKVCALEIFGPVVTLEPFTTFEDAIEKINLSEYGLQAGVFTNNLAEVNYAFRNLEVGGVIINDTPSFRVDHMPYGGVKNSGTGREGIRYSIMEMTEPRILVKNF